MILQESHRLLPLIEKHQPETGDEFNIQEIIDNQEIDEKTDGSGFTVTLKYGRKKLKINFDSTWGNLLVTTYISNVAETKKENETTLLYKAARRIMMMPVQTNRKVEYTLETTNPNMIAWAQNNGREIFQWDKEFSVDKKRLDAAVTATERIKAYFFTKTFEPVS